MKKLLTAFFVTATIAFTNFSADAQRNESKPSFTNLSVPNGEVDKNETPSGITKAEARALKNFNKNYKNASNVSWSYSGAVLVASFSENNLQKRAMYLFNGKWLHTLISYDESQLSDEVKSMVTHNYPKFRITTVTEVHEPGVIAYFINIENDKEIKQVIAHKDLIWTHTQFKKS